MTENGTPIIGIIGSRRRDSMDDFRKVLAVFVKLEESSYPTIVSGGCETGGDNFAELIAKIMQVPIRIHYPDKSQLDPELLKKNPRAAYARINYARNVLVARDSDIIIAVVAPDREGGTEDTLAHFRKKLGKTEKQLIAEGKLILV